MVYAGRVLAGIAMLAALTGCEATEQALNEMAASLDAAFAPTSGAVASRSGTSGNTAIDNSALAGLFDNAPYNPQAHFHDQFPRVALTVEKVPPNIQDASMSSEPTGCFELSAVIWRGHDQSETVNDIEWCVPRDGAYGISLADAQLWPGGAHLFSTAPLHESTGNTRTNGPVPPAQPIPSDPKHQRLLGGVALGGSTMTFRYLPGFMFYSVLYKMGFDWNEGQDRRVWITRFTEAG